MMLQTIKTEAEREILHVLVWTWVQYLQQGSLLSDPPGFLDHGCLSAGESAIELMAAYGLVSEDGRGGWWSPLGLAFIDDPNALALP
jgi:hypothetical protein